MGTCFSSPALLSDATNGRGYSKGQLDDDETLGHSFCYLRSTSSPPPVVPDAGGGDGVGCSSPSLPRRHYHHRRYRSSSFKSISGASVSANATSSRSILQFSSPGYGAGGFESSSSFAALPLQLSSAAERGLFLSGPIEEGAFSGPLDAISFSGPISGGRGGSRRRKIAKQGNGRRNSFGFPDKASFLLRRSSSERSRRPWVVPVRNFDRRYNLDKMMMMGSSGGGGNVQWAHGKAGEDRVHVVVSEEHRWLFVGIYDGFNGPDAPEFLVRYLYRSVFNELEGLFWEEEGQGEQEQETSVVVREEDGVQRVELGNNLKTGKPLWEFLSNERDDGRKVEFSVSDHFVSSLSKLRNGFGSLRRESRRLWFPNSRYGSEEKAKVGEDVTNDEGRRRIQACQVADHGLVLGALLRALEITELEYLEMTDSAMDRHPELALMGSCVLVVLMKGEDMYVMNVGDSRAIVAQCKPRGAATEMMRKGNFNGGVDFTEGIVEEVSQAVEECMESPGLSPAMELGALQLTVEHSTSNVEEVLRIKEEHPDDSQCIVNGRVKGRLKVTRAFGVGYLKQPKWNNGLLEMFRNEYIGTAPYISCSPCLCHHKLGPNDRFLVLSSDGLYQYLTNEEVVSHVETFMEKFPDGDPAQSLIEELLLRAARKAGMDFHELLDIPQGDRRKFHDDVTVMIISLEGRIWKSTGKYV